MNQLNVKMKIKKGDTVVVLLGKDRGKKGMVIKSDPVRRRVVVDGLNLVKKHVKPKRGGQKGQIVSVPSSIEVSNVQLFCTSCKKGSRVRIERSDDMVKRMCVRCNVEIPVSKKE